MTLSERFMDAIEGVKGSLELNDYYELKMYAIIISNCYTLLEVEVVKLTR